MAGSYKFSAPLLITIAIFFIIIPTSLSDEKYSKNKKKGLKALCSKTSLPTKCWEIIESKYPEFDKDDKGVAAAALDLAITRAGAIHDRITLIERKTKGNNGLKEKYGSCAKRYDSVVEGLKKAKKNLGSENISKEIEDVLGKVKKCKISVNKGPFKINANNVRCMNEEFDGFYGELVKAAIDRLLKKNE